MQDFLQGEEEVPYQARLDLTYLQKKKELALLKEQQARNLQEKRALHQNRSSPFSKPQSPVHQNIFVPNSKQVNFHEVASIGTSTADFIADQPTMHTQNYNYRPDVFIDTFDKQSEQSFKLPNISATPQVMNSKSMKFLKPIQQRAVQKSQMEYGPIGGMYKQQSQAQLHKLPNPIMGESEGEERRREINEQYKEYLRRSMERSKEHSLSKSAQKIARIRNSPNHSPQQPNIYAQKQRYKHSYFNFNLDKEQSKKAIEEMLFEPSSGYESQAQHYKRASVNLDQAEPNYATLQPENRGFNFKNDDTNFLRRQEQLKQQYLRDLKDQMAQNEVKKANDVSKFKQYDKKYAQEMQTYNPFGKGGAGAPLRDQDGRVLAERVGYFSESRTVVPERDLMSQIQLLRKQSRQTQKRNEDTGEIKNAIVDDYEQEVQRRERAKEEWRHELESQLKEQERAKKEAVMKKKKDDERDEERIHQQLKEINDEFQKEKLAKIGDQSEFQSRVDPRDLKRVSRKSVVENYVSPERLERKHTTRMPTDTDVNDYQNDYNIRPNKYLDNMRLREERDHQENMISKSLVNLRQEANRQRQQTDLAVDKLNRMQYEISLKQRQNDIQNQDFFNKMIEQNKAMMSSLKYTQPLNEALNTSSKIYLTPAKKKSSHLNRMYNSKSEFVLPKPKGSDVDIQKIIPKHYPEQVQSNLKATQDLEELLQRLQS